MTAEAATAPALPANRHPFDDSVDRLLAAAGPVAGRRVLICGENVAVFMRALLDRGATVEVAMGSAAGRERVLRQFPGTTVRLRNEQFTAAAGSIKRYDLVILWDGFGPALRNWIELMNGMSEQVWADVMNQGWQKVTYERESLDFFPDAIVRAAAARPADQVTDPLLVHVHVPKNGGSSVNDALFESFGFRYVPMYVNDPFIQQKADHLKEHISKNTEALVIASHNLREFPQRIGRRPLLHVTFLRHSIARHLSYYRYARKHYDSFGEEHRRTLPQGFMEMTPQDYLRFEAGLFEQGYGHDQLRTFDERGDVAAAKSVLEGFFMVGVVEQLDRGLALLRRKLKAVDMHLLDLSAGRANTTDDLYGQTAGILEDPATLEAAAYLKDDLELYNWAKERFERECVMYGV